MSSAKRNSSSTSVYTLDLACNLLRLKSFPSKRYLIGIPLSPSWKASVCMAENIMLNSVEASTQPCLTPFVTGNGSENSPSFRTLASIPSWNYRTIAMNLAGQPDFAITFQSPSRLTVSNVLVRSTKVMWRSTFCSWHFSWSCRAVKIISIVPLFSLNPYWLSGRSPDHSRCSFDRFSKILARIFPAIDNKVPSNWQ